MTETEWRAELDQLGSELRDTLAHEQVAYVRWEPNNGTAYELFLIPWEALTEAEEGARTMYGGQMGPGWIVVASLHGIGGTYPIRLWEEDGHIGGRVPFPDYLGEHLARGRGADGAALHLLLSAVAGCEPVCSLRDADITVAAG